MSSMSRPLTAPNLTFDLDSQLQQLRAEEAYQRSGRAGRTLARSGRLRITLVALASDHRIGTHRADSPMTLHVLTGHIRFRAEGRERELGAGQLLFFGPGDANDLVATEESSLLLTISALDDDMEGAIGGGPEDREGLPLD